MNFEFVSHDEFPDDKYVKEVVYLCIDGKHRVGYIKKILQNGAAFWDVIGTSATKDGNRVTLKGYITDSNFLHEDIMHFLKTRGWEKRVKVSAPNVSVNENIENEPPDDNIPF